MADYNHGSTEISLHHLIHHWLEFLPARAMLSEIHEAQ